MDGTQLVVVQLTKRISHKARCRERLHCLPKRCNIPEACLSGGKTVSLEEAQSYVALTYCKACVTIETRARLRFPDRCKNGTILDQLPKPARRPQGNAAVVSEKPPAPPQLLGMANLGARPCVRTPA